MPHDLVTMFEHTARYGTKLYNDRPPESFTGHGERVLAHQGLICWGWNAKVGDLIANPEMTPDEIKVYRRSHR